MEKKVNDFIIFCMQVYKTEKGLTGEEVSNLFKKYNVYDYLKEGFDMLHTQGEGWLINDIDEFLKNRET